MNSVNGTALAVHLVCTRETISDYVAHTVIVKLADGNYDQDDCRARVLRHLRDKAAGRSGAGDSNLSSERALLAKEQRESVSLKNAISRGDFASLPVIQKALMVIFAVIRERLLSIPGKLADALSMRTREEIELILRGEIVETLNELHDPTDLARGSGMGDDQGGPPSPQASPDPKPD